MRFQTSFKLSNILNTFKCSFVLLFSRQLSYQLTIFIQYVHFHSINVCGSLTVSLNDTIIFIAHSQLYPPLELDSFTQMCEHACLKWTSSSCFWTLKSHIWALYFSEPQFPCFQKKNTKTYILRKLWVLQKMQAWHRAFSKGDNDAGDGGTTQLKVDTQLQPFKDFSRWG